MSDHHLIQRNLYYSMSSIDKKIKQLESQISRLKSSVDELRVLNDIAVSSGKATDIDQILNLIVQKSINATDAEQGSILLVTKNKDKRFKTIIRQDDTSSLKHNYHIGTNITGWVLQNKKPLIIKDLSIDERFNPSEEEKKEIKSVLCVPIWYEGNIIGLLMLINKKNQENFSDDDITLFSIISVQAGQLIKNMELQRKAFQERKESEKLQELDKLKTNFFTNISHEFRTPLTLILGQAKQILNQSEQNKFKERIEIIYQNGKKLKNLTDQVLDLSRIEAGQMKLKAAPYNIIKFIQQIISLFESFAEIKNITLSFYPREQELILYFDREKMDKILSNLLSNALKFTPKGGKVDIEAGIRRHQSSLPHKFENERKCAEIIISDNGIGISGKELNKIFERFYQAEDSFENEYGGTGIGLSLTKELVELHKGKISAESRPKRGSTFTLWFPLGKEHLLPDEIRDENMIEEDEYFMGESISSELVSKSLVSNNREFAYQKGSKKFDPENLTANKSDKPLLLVIEDNKDLRKFISDILAKYYSITEAVNGKEGLDKSFKKIPDIIISDIMMPEIDGIQLCKELKSDPRTSHIPLILLTAKSTTSDKLEGLEIGADDYITKPFDELELKVRIRNLLEQRQRIHSHFQKNGFIINEADITSLDQKFLRTTLEIIEAHLSDSEFSVKILADNLAVSRSLLHKKLISLVGESPTDLIKRLRINKAAKLIEQKWGNVSEIAFEVGFSNPSYFARCFQKQFGFNPSEYHQNINPQ